MSDEVVRLGRYKRLLEDIQELLERARAQAYKAVDNIRVQTYWQIGGRIAREELKHKERAAYSKKVVNKLAADLGFSRVILYRILQFYKFYPIVSTVPRQLSWSHYEVHYALGNLNNRIFVAEYKAKLPSEKDIAEKLKKLKS